MNINFVRLVALAIVGGVAKSFFGQPVTHYTQNISPAKQDAANAIVAEEKASTKK